MKKGHKLPTSKSWKRHEVTKESTKIYQFSQQEHSQPAITCSKLTIETLEQGLKYVQS